MGDTFLEQMVIKKDMPKDKVLKVAVLLSGLVIILIAAFLQFFVIPAQFGMFFILVLAGAIYYTWYFVTGLNLEFEYIYTNGEIDFDKISAKRKRKRIVTLKISQFTDFGKYDYKSFDQSPYKKVINASEFPLSESTYYAAFTSKEGEAMVLLFTPNDRLLAEINKFYRKRG